jgi:hypothetical protein
MEENMIAAVEECEAKLSQGGAPRRRGAVIPNNIRRDAAGTAVTAAISNAACALVLLTPITAVTITSLPITHYSFPSPVAVGPGCGTDLGQAPCPTPDCDDNLGQMPCSSALSPATTTSINGLQQ